MANYIEKSKIDPRRFVPVSSRYTNSTVLYYGEQKLLTYNLYKKTVQKTSSKDKYFVVTPGTEYRPDLVSQTAYGTTDFWWKIMEANDIKDIFDFKAGLNIRIPDNIFG